MKRNMRHMSVVCLLLLVTCINVYADDSLLAESGHNVYPINTDKIRMVYEKVTVRMDDTLRVDIADGGAYVDCEFVFENTSNEEIYAKVGFPGFFFSRSAFSSPAWDKLMDFKTIVDGNEKKVDVRKEGDSEMYRYWYTWDATFPPKTRVTIKNTYWVILAGEFDTRMFEYVLETGANWKGPIGKAVIEIVYKDEEDLREKLKSIKPEGYRIDKNRIIWELTDLVPTENIKVEEIFIRIKKYLIKDSILSNIRSTKYSGNKRLYVEYDIDKISDDLNIYAKGFDGIYYKKQDFFDEARRFFARVKRNEIFARHGRELKSKELQEIFGSTKWYKPDPNYSDDMLNEIEKKNVQFILDYEMKMGRR